MRQEKVIFRKNKNVVARKIDQELFLIPVIKTQDDVSAIYTLNKMAIKVWELIDGKSSLKKIRDTVLEKYNVQPRRLERDLESFIKDALKIKVINKVR